MVFPLAIAMLVMLFAVGGVLAGEDTAGESSGADGESASLDASDKQTGNPVLALMVFVVAAVLFRYRE